MKVFIGTSGWFYRHWFGKFYPKNEESPLKFYSRNFNAVELNTSFYFLPKREYFERWYQQTPNVFIFAIKAPRYITHFKKLVIGKLDQEFINRISILKEKLGPILFQLPPSMQVDLSKLENFLRILPKGNSYVFEFRHRSWYVHKTYRLLQKYKVIFCIHDHHDGKTDFIKTADEIYLRFHGPGGTYGNLYSPRQLKQIWEKVLQLKPKTVYAFFNNDAQAFAVQNAKQLIEISKG